MFIAIAGAMQGMMHIDEGAIVSGKSMLVVLCIVAGTIIGELIGIEKGFERFGEWLKKNTGNSGDKQFVNAFVTASLTVCIGAMAIVGAIQDGILGDYSKLAVKSVLDLIIVAVMTSSLGKDCTSGQYAPGSNICGDCGIYAMDVLKKIKLLMRFWSIPVIQK